MSIHANKSIGELGQRLDCHFYSQRKGNESCTALRCFYNGDLSDDRCVGCPFFKTDEEFFKGWKRNEKN